MNGTRLLARVLRARRARVLVGAAAVAASMAGTTATTHADIAASYPGGCIVAFAVTVPTSCTYANLGGDSEILTYQGAGSVTVSGCQASTTYFGSLIEPTTYNLTAQTAGATCLVQLNGAGVAMVVDSTHAWGACAAFSFGAPLDPAVCDYVALQSVGVALGQVDGDTNISLTITVQDLSTSTTVASCSANGLAVVTQDCLYTETVGHHYQVTMTSTGGQFGIVTAGR